jgi:hypothetical protein
MVSEFIYIGVNLGTFTTLVWNLVSVQPNSVFARLKSLFFFIFCYMGFYLFFYSFSQNGLFLFSLKIFFFKYLFLLSLFVLLFYLIFVIFQKVSYYPILVAGVLGTYLFFLFFGLETLYLWNFSLSSYSLLKAQNPMIATAAIFFLFLPKKSVQWVLFFVAMVGLFFYSSNRKKGYVTEDKSIFYRYIPFEFFLDGDSFILEAPPEGESNRDQKGGLYIEKRSNFPEADRLYQFNLRSIRKVMNPCRAKIQRVVSHLEFPIVIKNKNIVSIFEVHRTFREVQFTIYMEVEKCEAKINGPIF